MTESENIPKEDFKAPLSNSGTVEETTPPAKSHKLVIVGLVFLLFLTTGTAVYVITQNQSLKSQMDMVMQKRLAYDSQTCTFNSKTYHWGEQFVADDGCNSCTCGDNGQVACTEMACISDEETGLDPTADWETYTNPVHGYSYNYPQNWSLGKPCLKGEPQVCGDGPQVSSTLMPDPKKYPEAYFEVTTYMGPACEYDVEIEAKINTHWQEASITDVNIGTSPGKLLKGITENIYKDENGSDLFLPTNRRLFNIYHQGICYQIVTFSLDNSSTAIHDQILSTFEFVD